MRAMILAAGRGQRMRPLTDTTPKPLLEVSGKPLIVWHIERLVAAGLPDIVINHAWLGAQIEQALGDGGRFGARIQYSPEAPGGLETAGGIVQALPFFQGEPFLVINGDIWCDWDPAIAPSLAAHLGSANALAWLLLVNNPPQHPEGDFVLKPDGRVSDLAPAPANPALDHTASQRAARASGRVAAGPPSRATEHISDRMSDDISNHRLNHRLNHVPNRATPSARALTFAGIGVYQPALFAGLQAGVSAALAPLLRQAMAGQRVLGAQHAGDWEDVGTPERLLALNQRQGALPAHAGTQ